ncbi:MAG: hypothetical protein SWI22_08620 [Pseudomonadota bacterium]|nr:hypothetical protein [Pseudomonadota bacterium]
MAAAILLTTAAPALACVPPPPPHWPGLMDNDAVSIFLGRVDRVEPLADETFGAATVSRARAHIALVEVIQGAPTESTAQVEGATNIRFGLEGGSAPVCLDYLSFDEGDLALVISGPYPGQRQVIDAALAAHVPQLTPIIEKHR